jgi:hypothetical protein
MKYRSPEKRSVDRNSLRGDSSHHAGHMAASSALLMCVLMVAICVAPLTPTSASNETNQSDTAASTQAMQTTQPAAQMAVVWFSFGEDANEANPLHLPRPRVMALIGVGLLAIGVFLRRREGRKGV